jgi:hypothetical protein
MYAGPGFSHSFAGGRVTGAGTGGGSKGPGPGPLCPLLAIVDWSCRGQSAGKASSRASHPNVAIGLKKAHSSSRSKHILTSRVGDVTSEESL